MTFRGENLGYVAKGQSSPQIPFGGIEMLVVEVHRKVSNQVQI